MLLMDYDKHLNKYLQITLRSEGSSVDINARFPIGGRRFECTDTSGFLKYIYIIYFQWNSWKKFGLLKRAMMISWLKYFVKVNG